MRLRTPAEARKAAAAQAGGAQARRNTLLQKYFRHANALRALGAAFLYTALLPGLLTAQAAELELTPGRLNLEVGRRQPLYAAIYDRQGNLVTSASITFATSDSTVATVSADGTVSGVGNGSATVEATSGSLRATVAVTVTGGAPAVQVAALRVEPRTLWLLPLEPARVAVHATLADGSPATGAGIRWKSSNLRVATVDRDGLVVGVAPGQVLVEAAAGRGAADTVLVIVDTARFSVPARVTVAPGGSDTIAVVVPAQQGRRLAGGLTWSSSDSSVADVGAGGVVRGRGAGSATLSVSGYGMTGQTTVVVHRPVQSLTITPAASGGSARLVPRTSRRFEVIALAADSTPVPEATIAWSVADSTVARFDAASGTLEALRPGTTSLSAAVNGFEPVTWQVEVVPGRIALDRTRFGLVLGARDSLRATLTDESAAPIDGSTPAFTWSSTSASVAVSGDGVVEARALGRATVTATSEWGATASADLFVTGELLVASSRGGATPQSLGIHQIPPGTSELVTILSDGAANIEPAWSPDRSRIAYSSSRAGTYDLYVMDADGANVVRVTADSGSESAPAWSPDGARLYFVSDQGGGSAIESVAIDGSGRAVVARGPGGHRTPAVARDGRVAFASARDGNFEIYVAGADGGAVQRVTSDPAREHFPRWLPGGVLAYIADAARGGSAIVRLGAEGAARIVESPDPIVSLAASRDGSRIAWVAGRMLDRGGSEIEYRLEIRPLTGSAAPIVIRAAPGEQLATPSF